MYTSVGWEQEMYLPPKVDGELNEIRLIKHLMLRLAQSDQTFSLSLLSTSKIDIDFFHKGIFHKGTGKSNVPF